MISVPEEQLAVGWVAFVLLVGLLPASFTDRSRSGYSELKKPSFAPPPWLFGVAWPVLYILMGVAAYLVQEAGGFFVVGVNRTELALFLVLQAVLAMWSIVFSGRRRLGLSVLVVLAGFALSITVAVLFWPISQTAAWLVIPTVAWLAFASLLAVSLRRLNRKRKKSKNDTESLCDD